MPCLDYFYSFYVDIYMIFRISIYDYKQFSSTTTLVLCDVGIGNDIDTDMKFNIILEEILLQTCVLLVLCVLQLDWKTISKQVINHHFINI